MKSISPKHIAGRLNNSSVVYRIERIHDAFCSGEATDAEVKSVLLEAARQLRYMQDLLTYSYNLLESGNGNLQRK